MFHTLPQRRIRSHDHESQLKTTKLNTKKPESSTNFDIEINFIFIPLHVKDVNQQQS